MMLYRLTRVGNSPQKPVGESEEKEILNLDLDLRPEVRNFIEYRKRNHRLIYEALELEHIHGLRKLIDKS